LKYFISSLIKTLRSS